MIRICDEIRIVRSIRQGILMALVALGLPAVCAQAAVTLQTFSGPVEVQFQGGGWTPASVAMELIDGDAIATKTGGTAQLRFEDGSTLALEPDTQLAIQDLQYSEADKVRVSRLKLLWGGIVGKATPLDFQQNIFEVETATTLAGFKFSGMRIVTEPSGELNGNLCPCTELYPRDGVFEIRTIAPGYSSVFAEVEAAPGVGVHFVMDRETIVGLEVAQNREREQISVKSNRRFPEMRSLLSRDRNVLRIDNEPEAPVIEVGFQRYVIEIEQDSTATLGFAPEQAEQQIRVGVEGIDGVFVFGQNAQILPDRLYVFANEGEVWVSGEPLAPGTSILLPIMGGTGPEQPAPIRERPEQPLAPPGPEGNPASGGGPGIIPTPSPTPTPTATPTPERPEEPEEPEPQPTATPAIPPVPTDPPQDPVGSPILP